MAAALPMTDAAGAAHEVLRRLREETRRWARQLERPRLDAGEAELNRCLAGGWPLGKVGELIGPHSSGRTTAVVAAVAAATQRGEVVAWIDAADAFDPASAAAAGVDLQRVLWVRVEGVERAVRAAEVVLEVGGFTVVVVDIVGGGGGERRRRGRRAPRGASSGSLRLRLARAAERASAVVLVLVEEGWAGTLAGSGVRLAATGGCWGGGGADGAPVWLEGGAVRVVEGRAPLGVCWGGGGGGGGGFSGGGGGGGGRWGDGAYAAAGRGERVARGGERQPADDRSAGGVRAGAELCRPGAAPQSAGAG